jgi:hypothetical protein
MNKNQLQNIQIEVDASYLYQILAENEDDANVAHVFKEMSEIEKSHALAFLKKNGLSDYQMPNPSKRAKFLHLIGKMFGYDYILGVLLDTEKSVSSGILNSRTKSKSASSISDTAHVTILKNIIDSNKNISGATLARCCNNFWNWQVDWCFGCWLINFVLNY